MSVWRGRVTAEKGSLRGWPRVGLDTQILKLLWPVVVVEGVAFQTAYPIQAQNKAAKDAGMSAEKTFITILAPQLEISSYRQRHVKIYFFYLFIYLFVYTRLGRLSGMQSEHWRKRHTLKRLKTRQVNNKSQETSYPSLGYSTFCTEPLYIFILAQPVDDHGGSQPFYSHLAEHSISRIRERNTCTNTFNYVSSSSLRTCNWLRSLEIWRQSSRHHKKPFFHVVLLQWTDLLHFKLFSCIRYPTAYL